MCNQLKIRETQPVSSANFCHFLITSCSREKTPLYHTASDGKLGGGGGGGLQARLRPFHQLVFDDGGLYHHVIV